MFCPLRIHGDDVAQTKTKALHIINVTSALASHMSFKESLAVKLLVTAFVQQEVSPTGLIDVLDAVRWSLEPGGPFKRTLQTSLAPSPDEHNVHLSQYIRVIGMRYHWKVIPPQGTG